MTFVHGKDTYVSVNSTDLSTFTNTSTYTRGRQTHDVTTYGKDDEVHRGGLRNGGFSMGGTYDNGASGPKEVLEPLLDTETPVTVIRRPEGTGSGLPQESFAGLLSSYVETNPVADMVSWSAEFKISDAVTRTTQ